MSACSQTEMRLNTRRISMKLSVPHENCNQNSDFRTAERGGDGREQTTLEKNGKKWKKMERDKRDHPSIKFVLLVFFDILWLLFSMQV